MAKLSSIDGSVADFTLPENNIGGDYVVFSLPSKSADVESSRNGVTISLRKWRSVHKWRMKFNRISSDDVEDLREYFEIRVFKMHPHGFTPIFNTVRWVEPEFLPNYISPGYYNLAFTIEEVQT